MYKVNVFKNNGELCFSKYFEIRSEAVKYVAEYNSKFRELGRKAVLKSKKVNVRYHHTALEKGYARKGTGGDTFYAGKFGLGFKRHIENCVRSVSNQYHFIEYFIEEN